MQAVIRVGSHQYAVEPGHIVEMEKLHGPAGSEVAFEDILMISDGKETKVGKDAKGKVLGVILSQDRGKKIEVFRRKKRKGYHKSQGHRQDVTRVEITKVEA